MTKNKRRASSKPITISREEMLAMRKEERAVTRETIYSRHEQRSRISDADKWELPSNIPLNEYERGVIETAAAWNESLDELRDRKERQVANLSKGPKHSGEAATVRKAEKYALVDAAIDTVISLGVIKAEAVARAINRKPSQFFPNGSPYKPSMLRRVVKELMAKRSARDSR